MMRALKEAIKSWKRYFYARRYRKKPRIFSIDGEENVLPSGFLSGKTQPLEVEIGCGRGKFLVARAEKHPERYFLGIDKAGKWMKRGWRRAQRKQLNNLRFLKWDARAALGWLKPKTVHIIHIYFPDPWPKKRHRERRLVDAGFLKKLHSKLIRSGLIEIATDDQDYFGAIKKAVQKTAKYWDNTRESVNARLFEPELKTNYELKFEAEGRPLYYLELRKK